MASLQGELTGADVRSTDSSAGETDYVFGHSAPGADPRSISEIAPSLPRQAGRFDHVAQPVRVAGS